jgi:hypothetical protein
MIIVESSSSSRRTNMNLNKDAQGFVNKMDENHEVAMAWKDGVLEMKIKCLAKDFRRNK